MSHFKALLLFLIVSALAALLWLQEQPSAAQKQKLEQLQDLLKKQAAFHLRLGEFYDQFRDKLKRTAAHPSLLGPLSLAAETDRRGKNLERAHQSIQTTFPFKKRYAQGQRLYVFSKDHRLLMRTDREIEFENTPHPLSQLPFVQLAAQAPVGTWKIDEQDVFVISHLVQKDKQPIGILLHTIPINADIFFDLGFTQTKRKETPLLFFGTSGITANGVPTESTSTLRNWFTAEQAKLLNNLKTAPLYQLKGPTHQDQAIPYALSRFPGEINHAQIGYLFFVPPNTTQTTQNKIFGLDLIVLLGISVGLAFLLWIWLSIGLSLQKRRLLEALQYVANNPNQPTKEARFPGAFRRGSESLQTLLDKYQRLQKDLQQAQTTAQQAQATAQQAQQAAQQAQQAAQQAQQAQQAPLNEKGIPQPFSANTPQKFAPPVPGQISFAPALATQTPAPTAPTPAPAQTQMPAPAAPTPAPAVSPQTSPPVTIFPTEAPSSAKSALDSIQFMDTSLMDATSSLDSALDSVLPGLQDNLLPMTPLSPKPSTAPVDAPKADSTIQLNMMSADAGATMAYTSMTEEEAQHVLKNIRGNEADTAPTTQQAPPSTEDNAQGTIPNDDAALQKIFQDYLDLRKRCGEPIEGLAFDSFSAKLQKQRQGIIQQFGCKDVRFYVYEKSGKAALKATPVQ